MRFANGLSTSTLLAIVSFCPPLWATGLLTGTTNGQLAYEVRTGDTLESIADKTTGNLANWADIARANKLTKAQLLRVGKRLIIPRELVAERSTVAQVVSTNGKVSLQESAAAASGHLGEGSRVETAQGASVLLRLQDGTKIKIEPGSQVILERMRQYYASDAVDARIRLERGRMNVDSPVQRNFPFEVKTQRGTAAVRGTEFRVAANGAANSTEVLRGAIAYQAARTALSVPAGDGLSLPANSDKPIVERLSAAPTLSLQAAYSTTEPELNWEATQGMQYRAVVTRDAPGLAVLSDEIVKQASTRFASPQDGLYFLHVRAVSGNGIEGYSKTQAFEVKARPLAPNFIKLDSNTSTPKLLEVRLVFAPLANHETLVQFADDLEFKNVLLEATSASDKLDVPATLYGKKVFFRLASVEAPSGARKRGPFGPAREILW
jgi:hypothetical protein